MFFHLNNDQQKNQIYYHKTSADSSGWQTWNKPQNAKIVSFFVVGGGGGGGAGRAASSNSGYAGGGGGSSAITRAVFPAIVLPDTLYVYVGGGGTGGASRINPNDGLPGSTGEVSFVSVSPNFLIENILLQSSGSGGGGGGGRSSINSTAGDGGPAWSSQVSTFASTGLIFTTSGQAGVVGSNSVTPTRINSGGAGGGRATSSSNAELGGDVLELANGFFPTLQGGEVATLTSRVTGSNGFNMYLNAKYPQFFMGGAGGGGSLNTIRAGDGGKGAPGAGGGGGGSCYNDSSGGGGDGGQGLVVITSY